jgi:uncharacterized surface protein with fasciclin (FAS1) repeats
MSAYAPVLKALSGAGPFTVFAPTNEAFAAAGVDVSNVALVTAVLKFHVLSGAVPSSALAQSQSVPTLNGESVSVTAASDGRVFVNGGAQVVIADVFATNGVVHVVDSLLIPPSLLNAKAEIEKAITTGAKWYDSGDIEGCFVRYLGTAMALSGSLRAAPIKQAQQEGMRSDFSEGAWTLRREFNRFTDDGAVALPTYTPVSNNAQKSIVETAIATPALSTLVSVLTMPAYAPVLRALSGAGPFTVFAPTDTAFAAAGVDVSDVALVTAVLKFHVLSGSVPSSALAQSQSVPTLNGESVSVTAASDGRVFVNGGAQVVIADVFATNGVVHVVDEVLLPPSVLDARAEIAAAIAEGSPLYNDDDREGCFVRYLATAMALSGSLRAAPIAQAQREGRMNDFSSGAWTLRQEFDRYTGGSQNTQRATTTPAVSSSDRSTIRAYDLNWDVTNDSVMGGISDSRVTITSAGEAQFAGFATKESNGGFANSLARLARPADFSNCLGVTVVLKGDGQRYIFELRDSSNNMGISYEVDVNPGPTWQSYDIPLSMMEAERPFFSRGSSSSAPALDRSNIVSLGIKRTAFLKGFSSDPSFVNGAFSVSFREMSCMQR